VPVMCASMLVKNASDVVAWGPRQDIWRLPRN
jgi:hypothetical protein